MNIVCVFCRRQRPRARGVDAISTISTRLRGRESTADNVFNGAAAAAAALVAQ